MSDAAFKYLPNLGGIMTDTTPDKVPMDKATECFNIDLSIRGMIQTKPGRRLYGNSVSGVGSILRGFLYKKNYGTIQKIMLRVRDDGSYSYLEWLNASNKANASDDGTWEKIVDNLTTGAIMGFSPFNNTNLNQLVMCNAVESLMIWNGSTATISSWNQGASTITKEGSTTWAFEGFGATGSIIIDGYEFSYSGGTSGTTLSGVTEVTSGGWAHLAETMGVVQKPTSYPSLPKGNVLHTAAARLWVAGVKDRASTLYYSKVADCTNFTSGTNPADAGFEDFPDGGGPITLLESKENQKIFVHKLNALLMYYIEYTSTAKIPHLDQLSLADGSGATNQKAGTSQNKTSYFIAGTEGIKKLERIVDSTEAFDVNNILDVIAPTIAQYDTSLSSICFSLARRALFASVKSSSSANYNDKQISYFFQRKEDGGYEGQISIDDDYISDYVVDGKDVYVFSSKNQNTYKLFENNSLAGERVSHRYATPELTFSEPARDKDEDLIFVEGLIKEGTKIKVTIQYGIYGMQGSSNEKIISWDDGDPYVSEGSVSGALGDDILGVLPLGSSSSNVLDSRVFHEAIHFDAKLSPRYKIIVETYYDDNSSVESYWALFNLGSNPSLKSTNVETINNSNS